MHVVYEDLTDKSMVVTCGAKFVTADSSLKYSFINFVKLDYSRKRGKCQISRRKIHRMLVTVY